MRDWKRDLKMAHDAVRAKQDAPNMVRRATIVCDVRKGKKPRTYTFVGSTSRAALDDGVLLPDGMDGERYDANPVVLWAHDQSGLPIGKTVERRRSKDGWEFDVEFADTDNAREVEHLVETGFLKATSVGFRVTEYDRGASAETKGQLGLSPNGWIGRKWQLLELSIVPVGADPGALATAAAHELSVRSALAASAKTAGFAWPEAPTQETWATDNGWMVMSTYTRGSDDAEIAALKAEIKKLQDKLAKLQGPKPGAVVAAKPTKKEANMADEPTAARPDDEPMADEPDAEPEPEPEDDALAEINAKLDAISAACAQMMEMMQGQMAAQPDKPEGEPTDPEPERSAGLYDDLFAEMQQAREAAQKVAQ